ncbi:MAG: SdpI family protein [Bacilli bacterium]|nr:SdpI family protein [Bacilli bacterium]
MIYTLFLIPLLMIIVGFLMFKFPPKKINCIIGYRTKISMKNEKNWNYANKYCGKVWQYLGILMFSTSIILVGLTFLNFIVLSEKIITIIIILQVIIIIVSIYFIENKLKNK